MQCLERLTVLLPFVISPTVSTFECIIRHALQLRVGLGEATSWNCSGVVEQVVSVLEGDFFCVADEGTFQQCTNVYSVSI